jgi:uncharacterized repeat protein (TIGR02543 family)
VTLTANPNTGYTFAGWSGDATGTDASIQIAMTKNMAVTANFNPVLYTLTVLINPPYYGSATLSPPGGSYPAGTEVTILAKPSSAFRRFINWTGDATGTVTGTANPITFTMPASNITVTGNIR